MNAIKPTSNSIADLIVAYGDAQANYVVSKAPYGSEEYLALRASFIYSAILLQEAMRKVLDKNFVLMQNLPSLAQDMIKMSSGQSLKS